MPQAARPAGRHPGQARRERESAGGTGAKATVRRRFGLVRRYQKNLEIVMWLLHSQKGLDPERNGEVEPRFGILEVQAGDLPDPVQAVAQGVRMDTQLLRRMLLLAGFEVGPERGDQGALAGAVVLDQRAEVTPAVVDQPLVADPGPKAPPADLANAHHPRAPLDTPPRVHH